MKKCHSQTKTGKSYSQKKLINDRVENVGVAVSPLAGPLAHAIRHQLASVPTQKRRLDYRINSPPALAALPWPSYETKLSSTVRHSKVQVKALSAYSRSMASVLSSRHFSCTQSSAAGRGKCCQVTPCRVSSASGTKAGTVSKNTLNSGY